MTDREYLKSIGFTVGERGRFSAEMLAALSSRNGDAREEAIKSEIVKRDLPHPLLDKKTREPQELFGYTAEGNKVGFITCFKCSRHMMYCKCQLVTAPSIVVKSDSPLVRVGSV